MGLTKPRAAQIFNLDYKQSTRVVSTTNITLAGGAPNAVDSVNLSAGDRVLVTGQTTGSQNGLYYVSTLGSGSNGTWSRTSDGNENGEIEAGMIVMVSEGIIYADTQWKLITDDPITLGTTALTFTQNYSANSISSGTSNVVINSNANVTVSSAGTANVLTVSNTGAFVSGVVSATGNVAGNNFIGNVLATTVSAAGNITGGNILTANIIGTVGANVTFTANILPAANVTYDLGTANMRWRDLYLSGNTIQLGSATLAASGTQIVTGAFVNEKTISSNVQIEAGTNSLLVGPVTLANATSISVASDSTLNIM